MGESDHYGFSLTTFSPSGKLMQIEYALNAVKNGQPSVGLRASDGVVLATENKISVLYEDQPKVEKISQHIGCVYSGMGPDYRILVKKARKLAMEYELMYGEEIPTTQLVTKLAAVMQEYTQSGGVRPFGVSMLVAGWDHEPNPGRPLLFQCDPSGAYFAWKATALGKNDVNAKTFLEKRFSDALELDDGIHTALLTLRESFDVGMTEDNVEIAVCNKNGFMRLSKQQVKDHLETGLSLFYQKLTDFAEQNMSKTKYDFYQTETHVFVTILKRGLTLEQCKAHYIDGYLKVVAMNEVLLNIRLSHPINPTSLELKCSSSKVELKMAKMTSDQWETLEEKSEGNKNKPALISWDKFAQEAEDDEEKEDVNILFQKLYKDADDDTRKAMVKSYTESGGTVLSTNWKEISKKRTEIRPPDGMEFKKW